MDLPPFENIYGAPMGLVAVAPDARQFSPTSPGAQSLENLAPKSLGGMAVVAPPGSIERRYTLALILRALAPGAKIAAFAPKDKGGARIAQDLERLGCVVQEVARRHHRICTASAPGQDADAAIAEAIAEGAPRFLAEIDFWSQPGVFSWNRLDPGSALLLQHLLPLSGAGADFGCGVGVLSRAVLASAKVTSLAMIDNDCRAIDLANRNIIDVRAQTHWADARSDLGLTGLNFVVMNPPFHEGGRENQTLGQSFIQRAAHVLRKGGVCWLTANRHLPYEASLKPLFRRVTPVAQEAGYKIYQAMK